MSATVVRNKLLTVLNTVTNLPNLVVEGENFKPAKGSDYPFTRFTFLPREGAQQDLSTGKVRTGGLARVDLFYARSNNSVDTALTMAESIVTAFAPVVVNLSDCQLQIDVCWFEAVRHEPSAINIPIFVRWNSFAQ